METIQCPFATNAQLVMRNAIERVKGIIIICPGGAYEWKSPRELWPVADVFEQAGYGCIFLDYSVGTNLDLLPEKEGAWAVKTVRENIARGKPVILCGFSAGAHLAASVSVHTCAGSLSLPDAQILCYPVITTGLYAHKETIGHLTTKKELLPYFSLEKQVTPSVPPTFLWHTANDETVRVENSLLFLTALIQQGVVCEGHIYPFGKHGLSLASPEVAEPEKGRFSDSHVASWSSLAIEWLDLIL